MAITITYITDGVTRTGNDKANEDYSLEWITYAEQRDGADPRDSRTRIILKPKRPLTLVSCTLDEHYNHFRSGCKIFVNGYQSWTDTREFDLNEHLHNMNRVPRAVKERYHFESYGDVWFRQYLRSRYHGFTWAYMEKPDGEIDLIGSLNEERAFLIIDYRKAENVLALESDCEGKYCTEPYVLYDFVRYYGKDKILLQRRYFEHFGTCSAPNLRGYSSWYLHYQDISEAKMMTALEAVDSRNYDLFQIDDGYETFVGDWMEIVPEKFPNGLASVVDTIHAKGLKAGIWLSPFVCELDSRIYKDHHDWVYTEDGKDIFAGCNWSGDVVLDIRKKEVQDYIRECLEYHMKLGFDYFKLDFLYAAAMIRPGPEPAGTAYGAVWESGAADSEPGAPGRAAGGSPLIPTDGFTRAEMMRGAMKFLREILGDRLFLGCGVPLSSAFNLVDYCRIGCDISLKFDDVAFMRLMHRERISTKYSLQNTIYRSVMDGYVFRCDPDVFLLRDNDISLSKEQREALVTLNYLCGSVWLTSDNIGQYDAEKRELLQKASRLGGAQLTNIKKDKDILTLEYVLDGEKGTLRYDRKKGVLVKK